MKLIRISNLFVIFVLVNHIECMDGVAGSDNGARESTGKTTSSEATKQYYTDWTRQPRGWNSGDGWSQIPACDNDPWAYQGLPKGFQIDTSSSYACNYQLGKVFAAETGSGDSACGLLCGLWIQIPEGAKAGGDPYPDPQCLGRYMDSTGINMPVCLCGAPQSSTVSCSLEQGQTTAVNGFRASYLAQTPQLVGWSRPGGTFPPYSRGVPVDVDDEHDEPNPRESRQWSTSFMNKPGLEKQGDKRTDISRANLNRKYDYIHNSDSRIHNESNLGSRPFKVRPRRRPKPSPLGKGNRRRPAGKFPSNNKGEFEKNVPSKNNAELEEKFPSNSNGEFDENVPSKSSDEFEEKVPSNNNGEFEKNVPSKSNHELEEKLPSINDEFEEKVPELEEQLPSNYNDEFEEKVPELEEQRPSNNNDEFEEKVPELGDTLPSNNNDEFEENVPELEEKLPSNNNDELEEKSPPNTNNGEFEEKSTFNNNGQTGWGGGSPCKTTSEAEYLDKVCNDACKNALDDDDNPLDSGGYYRLPIPDFSCRGDYPTYYVVEGCVCGCKYVLDRAIVCTV